MKLKTDRLEALTDGVFAIVMTIMLVGMIELVTIKGQLGNEDFYKLFMTLGDDFISYAGSFLILGFLWLEHHWQFHHIKHATPVLVFINIVWFMFICLIPLTTALAGNYPALHVPLVTFEINILIVFVILYLQWIYATHKNRIVDESLDKKVIARHKNVGLILIAVILIAIVLTCSINR